MNVITSINLDVKSIPLIDSYNLSYKTLTSYDSVIVSILLDDKTELFGEVTPLEGYTDETIDDILKELITIRNIILKCDVRKALKILYDKVNKKNSFTFSAIIPPLEGYIDHLEDYFSQIKLSNKYFVYALKEENDKNKIRNEINHIMYNKYDTIKIKVGKSLKKELELVDLLSTINLNNLKIRFDANGGYTFDEAVTFLNKLSLISKNVDYLEQPLCKQCWKELKILIYKNNNIPIMIDESIYSLKDIEKSYVIGAKYIKIKLCKYGSLLHLQKALDYAKSLDLNVVFGNGVATDISNYYELFFYFKNKEKIYGAVESVGFLKIKNYLQFNLKDGFKNE